MFRPIMRGVYSLHVPTEHVTADTWANALAEIVGADTWHHDEPLIGEGPWCEAIRGAPGPATRTIEDYFSGDVWFGQLRTLIQQDPDWTTNWGQVDIKRLADFHYSPVWHRMTPNYDRNDWHIDCLVQSIHGLIYLSHLGEPDGSTQFVSKFTKDQNTTLVMDHVSETPTSPGQGWIILQNGFQHHRGLNRTNEPRYAFKFMYRFRLPATITEPGRSSSKDLLHQ
jgi:hypothetical protein